MSKTSEFAFELWEGEPAFYKPVSCNYCRGGYLRGIGLYELMPMTDEVEILALSRSSADEIGRAA